MSLTDAYIEDNNLNHVGVRKLLASKPCTDVAQSIIDHGFCDGDDNNELWYVCMYIIDMDEVIKSLAHSVALHVVGHGASAFPAPEQL